MCRNALVTCVVALSLSLLIFAFLIAALSATLPRFFVGIHAKYEFNGEITLNGQTVSEHASIINWTVLDLEKNKAEIDMEVIITHVVGSIPGPVLETSISFPNASWKETLELYINQSYWWYYLNDTANDLLKYKVGDETVESEVGMIQCCHLQSRRPRSEWDAFYDRDSGILINLQETFWVDNYGVTYNMSIIDSNAHLNVATAEILDCTTFFILATVVAIMVSIGFLALKSRRKSNLNMGKESVKLSL